MSESAIAVEFNMWGQSCTTSFQDEEAALDWLFKMYEKGWLFPVEMVSEDGIVLFDAGQLLEKIGG